ncbi:MAG TPA: type II toxin-antitoxin system RelE/ParE family toxin [Pirellulales bacterium]|jgi:mRNA interferase RelE/StbE|nr:type II toxin-antitoxin system RelE/ParE family toxin [Pirellulales bacterium]
MFEVILSPEAMAFYASVDRPLAKKLARCFAQLEREPRRHNNIKRLTGKFAGYMRYRIGDWRVIYRTDDIANRVLVLTIAHRREVYE